MIEFVTSAHILQSLILTVNELGVDHLGFTSDDIGCHSIHLRAAMSMFLNHVKINTIMLQDRWCSDTFPLYIRKQTKEFSDGVSAKMASEDTYSFYMLTDCVTTFDEEGYPKIINNPQSITSTYNGNLVILTFMIQHVHG